MDTNGNLKVLLLKDLCGRLPYGVKVCACGNKEYITTLKGVIGDEFFLQFDYQKTEVTKKADTYNIKEIKPYLRPMSSMTEEERNEYLSIKMQETERVALAEICRPEAISEIIDWLNARHFDYRGLIEKDLALEAPDGMYNF